MTGMQPTGGRTSRRGFLGQTMTTAAAGLATVSALSASGCSESLRRASGRKAGGFVGKDDVVLFQGDSITDAGRDRKTRGQRQRQAGPGQRLRLFSSSSHLLAEHCRRRPEDLQSRHQRPQGLPARRAMGQGLPRAQAQPRQHPDRRQRHLAQAQRPIRRHGRSLRERLPGPPGADANASCRACGWWSASRSCSAAGPSTTSGSPNSTATGPPPGGWRPISAPCSCRSSRRSTRRSRRPRPPTGPATAFIRRWPART